MILACSDWPGAIAAVFGMICVIGGALLVMWIATRSGNKNVDP